jgi:hypothetical protein
MSEINKSILFHFKKLSTNSFLQVFQDNKKTAKNRYNIQPISAIVYIITFIIFYVEFCSLAL